MKPLVGDLRKLLIERLGEWTELLLDCPDCERFMLNRLAEAIATFPSTSLLEPLRRLLFKDLEIWSDEKQEFEKAIAKGQLPNPNSRARTCVTLIVMQKTY